jgi:hypothetical protein
LLTGFLATLLFFLGSQYRQVRFFVPFETKNVPISFFSIYWTGERGERRQENVMTLSKKASNCHQKYVQKAHFLTKHKDLT